MSTIIHIRDLSFRCIIGIFPKERDVKQEVRINIVLHCEIPDAPKTDRIEDTVSYKSLRDDIMSFVEGSSFGLIETLADRIADICLKDPRVQLATVILDKPGALRYADSVAVEVSKTQS